MDAAILSDLYLAAARQEPFDAAWHACVAWVGGRTSSVGLFDPAGRPRMLAFPQADAHSLGLYTQRYLALDPFARALMATGTGRILHGHDAIAPALYEQSEFFNDFARRLANPVEHFLGANVKVAAGHVLRIGLQRARGEADFDARNADHLAQLCAHLPGVFAIRTGVGELEKSLDAQRAMANATASGIAIVTADGAIAHANARAEAICTTYRLTTPQAGGRIALHGRGLPGGFDARLARVAAGGQGETMLIRAEGRGVLWLELAWLPTAIGESCAWMPQRRQARAMMTLRVLDAAQDSPQKLRAVFALSKTEAEVAVQIAAGDGVAGLAAARGVSVNTLRTQIRAILAKTQSRSLRELAHLVNRI